MNRIKQLREDLNIKQSDFAKEFNVSQGTLSNWERGVHDPDNESLRKMREKFNRTSDYILGLSDDPTPPNKKNSAFAEYFKPKSLEEQILSSDELSEESKKDLEKYVKLLKLADNARKMNEGYSESIKPNFVH